MGHLMVHLRGRGGTRTWILTAPLWGVWLSVFCGWQSWDAERFHDLPELVQTAQSRAGIQSLSSDCLARHQLRMGWEGRPAYLTLFFSWCPTTWRGFLGGSVVKNSSAVQEPEETQVRSWVGKIPWRRAWQPTPVFLPGESLGQRSPEGYSPWGHKESDMTEVT